MACLDMYNSEHKGHQQYCAPMSPRISFSNDFVDSHHQQHHHQQAPLSREASLPPVSSSDFEFSVSNYSMMSADELFFKGRLLPFKDNQMQRPTTTLREELLVGDDGDEGEQEFSLRPPKGSTGWKGLLGLRRSHIGSKKADKTSSIIKTEASHTNNITSQDMLNEGGGSSCRDLEIEI